MLSRVFKLEPVRVEKELFVGSLHLVRVHNTGRPTTKCLSLSQKKGVGVERYCECVIAIYDIFVVWINEYHKLNLLFRENYCYLFYNLAVKIGLIGRLNAVTPYASTNETIKLKS